jgi:3,4-dihydroxy-2-butanone 4-phosphate synthase
MAVAALAARHLLTVVADAGREDEGDLVVAAEPVTALRARQSPRELACSSVSGEAAVDRYLRPGDE